MKKKELEKLIDDETAASEATSENPPSDRASRKGRGPIKIGSA